MILKRYVIIPKFQRWIQGDFGGSVIPPHPPSKK